MKRGAILIFVIILAFSFVSSTSDIIVGNYQDYVAYGEGIYDIKISGNILKFDVSYGGCNDEKENFNVIWDGSYLKSNPPQVKLYLILAANDSNCDRLWHNTLEFGLDKIAGLEKGSMIHLFGSAYPNVSRYKLVYWGEEEFNNSGICPDDLKTCPDGSAVGRELPNCEFLVCSSFEGCENIGLRNDGKYCTSDKTWQEQKEGNFLCENNFECNSNVCVSGKCVNQGLIDN